MGNFIDPLFCAGLIGPQRSGIGHGAQRAHSSLWRRLTVGSMAGSVGPERRRCLRQGVFAVAVLSREVLLGAALTAWQATAAAGPRRRRFPSRWILQRVNLQQIVSKASILARISTLGAVFAVSLFALASAQE